jgi:serine O-acetyltransferase
LIYRETKLGEDLTFPHARNILIHPDATIGDRVTIEHQVTVATTRGREGAPKIGNDVIIEAGAKVLGPINIGDGAVIGANTLVATDVPPGATAMGVPCRIIKKAATPAAEKPANGHSKDQPRGN